MTLNIKTSVTGTEQIISFLSGLEDTLTLGKVGTENTKQIKQMFFPKYMYIDLTNSGKGGLDGEYTADLLTGYTKRNFLLECLQLLKKEENKNTTTFRNIVLSWVKANGQNPELSKTSLRKRAVLNVPSSPRNLITGEFINSLEVKFSLDKPTTKYFIEV